MIRKLLFISYLRKIEPHRFVFSLLLFISLVTTEIPAYCQSLKITGIVKDDKGEPVPGVSVKIKNSTTGVITDFSGKYAITVKSDADILVFSFIGFEPQEKVVGNNKEININLATTSKALNMVEVVAIGYGTQKVRDLTGSISTANIEDINKAPVGTYLDALAGRVPGVQVTSPDGQPGSLPSVIIRGGNSVTQTNSPLYVIDGFPIEDFNNNSLNTNDIESITVLKDASSTAIYGSRGANGVILITTKRGKSGKTIISYDSYYALQDNLARVPVLNSYDFVKLQLETDSTRTKTYNIFNQNYNPTGTLSLDDYATAPSINWQDRIYRISLQQSQNLTVRGGDDKTRFSISGSFFNQNGILIASGFKRFQGRVVLDHNVNSKLKVGLNVNYSNIFTNGAAVGGYNGAGGNPLLVNAWKYRPINGSGNLDLLIDNPIDADVISTTNQTWNPLLTAQNELKNRTTRALTINTSIDYAFMPELKLRITGGLNNNLLRYDQFYNSQTVTGDPLSPITKGGPYGVVQFTDGFNYINENTLTFNKVFHSAHSLNVVVGTSVGLNTTASYGYGANSSAAVQIPDALGIDGLKFGTPSTVIGSDSQNKLLSFYGRANYSYKSKYLATATFRTDGSSKFVNNNQYGFFPSGALAWHASEESFLKSSKIISDLKFRGSYGTSGNNRVNDNSAYATIGLGGASSYAPGGVYTNGAYTTSLANPNLRWETTAETDLGIDLGFFHQNIQLTVDVYNKKTTNLLLNANLPATTGYGSAFENIGSVQNKGLEISITTNNITKKNFSWNSAFNITFIRSKVLALAENQQFLLSNSQYGAGSTIPAYIAQIGQPVSMFYGYQFDGIYQYSDFNLVGSTYSLKPGIPGNGTTRSSIRPGDVKVKDIDGSGDVDANDLGVIGNPNPKFFGGISNNFTYKGFDLNVFIQYTYGNQTLDLNRFALEGYSFPTPGSNMFATFKDHWTSTNPSNKIPRVGTVALPYYTSTLVEDGSFIRLKTVNLGYRLPAKIIQRLNISGLRFYISGQNLFVLSHYFKGLDPEVNSNSNALTLGTDIAPYPRPITVTFGLDLSL